MEVRREGPRCIVEKLEAFAYGIPRAGEGGGKGK